MSFSTGNEYTISDPVNEALYGPGNFTYSLDETSYTPLTGELDLSGPQKHISNNLNEQFNVQNIVAEQVSVSAIILADQTGQQWILNLSTSGEINTIATPPLSQTPTPTPTQTSVTPTPTVTPTVTPTETVTPTPTPTITPTPTRATLPVGVVLGNLSGSGAYTTDGGVSWNPMTIAPDNWLSVVHGNGVFIAVGPMDSILKSVDGIYWTQVYPGIGSGSWSGIAYGNGTFVIINNQNDNLLYSTDNGATWNMSYTPTENRAITFGGGVFVVVGVDGSTCYSSNGYNWTHGGPTSYIGYMDTVRITYHNNLFMIVTSVYPHGWVSSDGGQNWITTSPLPGGVLQYRTLVGGNSLFILAASPMSNTVYYTSNGSSWSSATLPGTGNWETGAFGGGAFYLFSIFDNQVATSSDGVNWTFLTLPSMASWMTATFES
jgi:hypothetical protein